MGPIDMKAMGRLLQGNMKEDQPKNVLFAGPNSKTADQEKLNQAKSLQSSGKSRDDIWNQTGWFQDPAKDWVYETPAPKITILPKSENAFSNQEGYNTSGRYGDFFDYKDAFAAYPKLKDAPTDVTKSTSFNGSVGVNGEMSISHSGNPIMGAVRKSYKDGSGDHDGGKFGLNPLIEHETQHLFDQYRKSSYGGAPPNFFKQNGADYKAVKKDAPWMIDDGVKELKNERPELRKWLMENTPKQNGGNADPEEWGKYFEMFARSHYPDELKLLSKSDPDLWSKFNSMKYNFDSGKPGDYARGVMTYATDPTYAASKVPLGLGDYIASMQYGANGTEVLARAAERRAHLNNDQRAARPPWLDYDIDEKKWLKSKPK
jgi:Large polyvalent protein associated domain 23